MQDLEALADEPVKFLTRKEMEDSSTLFTTTACRSITLWPVGPPEDMLRCLYLYIYICNISEIPVLQKEREDSQFPEDYDWDSLFPDPDLT